MAGANANSFAIENRRKVVRMNVVEREAEYSASLWSGRTVDADPVESRQQELRALHELALVSKHFIHSDAIEIVGSRRQSDRIRGVWSACLELVWQIIPCRRLVVDEFDHVAAGLIRPHCLENRALSKKAANAHRPEHLVSAERVEIDSQLVELHAEMWRALRSVAHCECATSLVDDRNDFAHGIHGSKSVGHVTECDDSCF